MDERDLNDDPLVQFEAWLRDARDASPQAETMTLATADADGRPSARQVLLRGFDSRGFVFFTNRGSRKAKELETNPRAALVFHWYELGRQVRVEGRAEDVDGAEARLYWASRPRPSRLAAWASPQSQPIASRDELDRLYKDVELRFGEGDVPLPAYWGGYRVLPEVVEFWFHRESRLHDRFVYVRTGDGWRRERLAP